MTFSDLANGQNKRKWLEYEFIEDVSYSVYTRRVPNVVDVLSFVGSLWASLFLIGNITTLVFSYNLMMSSLIRQLYHFDPHPNE